MPTKIKICGIKYKYNFDLLVNLNINFIGFIFAKSPRKISIRKAVSLSKSLPKNSISNIVAVFVNESKKNILNLTKLCNIKYVQLHGNESPEFCDELHKLGLNVIKAFRMKDKSIFKEIEKYKTFGILLDTYVQGKHGGTGKSFDWNKVAPEIKKIKQNFFIAGGLNEKNFITAVKILNPYSLDINSGIEIAPGKKDNKKIKYIKHTINNLS